MVLFWGKKDEKGGTSGDFFWIFDGFDPEKVEIHVIFWGMSGEDSPLVAEMPCKTHLEGCWVNESRDCCSHIIVYQSRDISRDCRDTIGKEMG